MVHRNQDSSLRYALQPPASLQHNTEDDSAVLTPAHPQHVSLHDTGATGNGGHSQIPASSHDQPLDIYHQYSGHVSPIQPILPSTASAFNAIAHPHQELRYALDFPPPQASLQHQIHNTEDTSAVHTPAHPQHVSHDTLGFTQGATGNGGHSQIPDSSHDQPLYHQYSGHVSPIQPSSR